MNDQVKGFTGEPDGNIEARALEHNGNGREQDGCGHEHHQHEPEHEREFCFEFDDKPYETKHHVVTAERIREIVGLPAGTAIVEILEDGQQKTLPEGEEVRLHHCSKFRKLPRFKRGRGRVEADLEALKRESKNAIIGPNNEYFILPEFVLPELFTQRTTDLLVVVVPTYPTAAPANFHVTWGLTLKSGEAMKNYTGPVSLYGATWGTFSHSVATETWNGEQDTFLNFIATVRARLQEGA